MANVLLIEPDAVLGRTYRLALEHIGHTVKVARSAQQALNAADDLRPKIVVLELQLASHNGIEFLHEFRSYTEWQNVPVVINTNITPGMLEASAVVLRRDMGVREILYKPRTSLQRLISTVNEVLRIQGGASAETGSPGEQL